MTTTIYPSGVPDIHGISAPATGAVSPCTVGEAKQRNGRTQWETGGEVIAFGLLCLTAYAFNASGWVALRIDLIEDNVA